MLKKSKKRYGRSTYEYRVQDPPHLAERLNIIFSRLQLINIVQGFDFEGFDRVVDVHVKNIRHKIEDNPQTPSFIKTVYGMGYKFIGEPDK